MPKLSRKIWLVLGGVLIVSLAVGFGVFRLRARQARSQALPADTVVILLDGDHATPSVQSVVVGKSVQFNSHDGQKHNISQGTGDSSGNIHEAHGAGTVSSGTFAADEGYRVAFNTAGTYYFYDTLHTSIKITIIAFVPSTK